MKKLMVVVIAFLLQNTSQAQNTTLIPYRKGTQWGFATTDKQIYVVPQHDWVYPFKDGYARVMNGNRYGVIDMKGKIIVPVGFDAVSDVSEGMFAVRQGIFPASLSGYYDTTGKVAIPFKFVDTKPFYKGKGMVTVGASNEQKNVFIDRSGNLIQEPYQSDKFQIKGNLKEGMQSFQHKAKWGYLNEAGNIVVEAQYEEAGDFQEGLACVKKNGKYGYIDRNNKTVIPLNFDMAGSFEKGVAIVYNFEKTNDEFQGEEPIFALINKIGKNITPFKYDFIGLFNDEGIAIVKKDNLYSFIDKSGKELIAFEYNFISEFYEGVAVVKKAVNNIALSGLIDKTGKLIYPLSEMKFTKFSEGLIAFEQNKKVGFMNVKGEIAIAAKYDAYIWRNPDGTKNTSEFKNGITAVIKDGQITYINNKGIEFYEE